MYSAIMGPRGAVYHGKSYEKELKISLGIPFLTFCASSTYIFTLVVNS